MHDSQMKARRPFGRMTAALAATVLVLVISTAVRAAELQPGEWAGTVTPPGSEALEATFTVGESNGEIQIAVTVMGLTLPFRDIEATDEAISFTWTPGPDARCELVLQDDRSYTGECIDERGETGYLTMVPPA